MQLTNTESRFGGVAKTLHWLIALLIVAQYTLAKLAEQAEHARAAHPAAALEQLILLSRHKSIGLTIFALALVRLAWRFVSPPPPFPPNMPPWQVTAARLTHYAFYALLFAMPITGLVMSAAANFPVKYFELFTLPNLVAPNDDLKELMEDVHGTLFDVLVVLAVVHILAALKHQFFDHDDVLRRMVPWWSR